MMGGNQQGWVWWEGRKQIGVEGKTQIIKERGEREKEVEEAERSRK